MTRRILTAVTGGFLGGVALSIVVTLAAAYNDAEQRRLERQADDTLGRPNATVHQLRKAGAS